MQTKKDQARSPSTTAGQQNQSDEIDAFRTRTFEASVELEGQINAASAMMELLANELVLRQDPDASDRVDAVTDGFLHLSWATGERLRRNYDDYFARVREERAHLTALARAR